MTIAKNPQRQLSEDREAETFIAAAGKQSEEPRENKTPTIIRFPPGILERIDRAARRLGLSRSAFVASSTVRELERMEEGVR